MMQICTRAVGPAILFLAATIGLSAQGQTDSTAGFLCLRADVPAPISSAVQETLATLSGAHELSFTESYGDVELRSRVVHSDGQIGMIERIVDSFEYGGMVERYYFHKDGLTCGETQLLENIVPLDGGAARAEETLVRITSDQGFWAERDGQPVGEAGAAYAEEAELSAFDMYDRFAPAIAGSIAESRYMPLDCRDVVETYEAGMGGAYACGSMAGYDVQLIEDDLRQALRLTRDSQTDTLWIDAWGFTRFGPMLEWRGEIDTTGAFRPDTIIVRVFIDQGTGSEEQRLAIGRLNGAHACFDGWVDVAGNPDHNEDARLLADATPLYLVACDNAGTVDGGTAQKSG
ncbi:MAG: hypothetical protein AAF414_13565 [Pseudomonadota bacterium]